MNITPPHLQHSHRENSPQLSGLPASADRATRIGDVPHCTCERDQEIKIDCMERLVTPSRRGTSPSWGPPPPCEQALSKNKVSYLSRRRLSFRSEINTARETKQNFQTEDEKLQSPIFTLVSFPSEANNFERVLNFFLCFSFFYCNK